MKGSSVIRKVNPSLNSKFGRVDRFELPSENFNFRINPNVT